MDRPAEIAVKHQRVAEYLRAHGLGAAVLSRRCNFSWYTAGAHNHVAAACDVGNSWLCVTAHRAVAVTSNIEAPRLREEELAGTDIDVLEFPHEQPARAGRIIRSVIGGAAAADAEVPGLDMPALEADFDRLRWVLTDAEIRRYRVAAAETARAVEAVARSAQPGQTESELAGLLSAELLRRDCTPWVLLVAADERVARFRHPLPTRRPADRYVMLATCAERGGLIAACTRLACFGALPEDLARKHRAVATVDAAMIAATRPGATLGDIFAEAQRTYAATGFPEEWRRHHQGGSTGYLPRERKASPGDTTPVLACQAFAWNPSIAGTKSEDTILCLEGGAQPLADPTDWPVVETDWNGRKMPRPAILER